MTLAVLLACLLAGAGLYRFTGRGFKAREDYYDFLDATVAAEQVSEVSLTAAGAAARAGAPAGVYRMLRNNAQAVSCTIAVTRCLFACVCGCIRCKLHGEAIACGKQLQMATLTS